MDEGEYKIETETETKTITPKSKEKKKKQIKEIFNFIFWRLSARRLRFDSLLWAYLVFVLHRRPKTTIHD